MTRKMKYILMATLLTACAQSKTVKNVKEAGIRLQVGQQLLLKGENNQAMSELLKAVQLNPDDAEIQNTLGLAYAQRGDMNNAQRHFQKAVNLEPEYSEARNHLCAIYVEQERYPQAIEECNEAVKNVIYATPERAYHNMGIAYERMGNLPKAIESYRKGLLHNENFVLSRKSLGKIYLNQKHYGKAMKELEIGKTACKASPPGAWGTECPDTYYHLALTYVKLKERSKAVAAFENCVDSDKQGEYGTKCRKHLTVLR